MKSSAFILEMSPWKDESATGNPTWQWWASRTWSSGSDVWLSGIWEEHQPEKMRGLKKKKKTQGNHFSLPDGLPFQVLTQQWILFWMLGKRVHITVLYPTIFLCAEEWPQPRFSILITELWGDGVSGSIPSRQAPAFLTAEWMCVLVLCWYSVAY